MGNNPRTSLQDKDKIANNQQEQGVDYGEKFGNTKVISKTTNIQGYSASNEQCQPDEGKPFLKFFFIKDNHKPYAPLTILANTLLVKTIKRIIKRLTTKSKQNRKQRDLTH